MQFNSYGFALLFLPVSVIAYYLATRIRASAGKLVIIAASIAFYAFGRVNMLLYLGISLLINYVSALIVRKYPIRSKVLLTLPVIVNVGLLLYFKYLNFALENISLLWGRSFALKEIVLPLGISFYTFQQIAYIVSVERGELDNLSLIDYLAYILYFPKLLMGPIADPAELISQLNDPQRKRADWRNLAIGIKLFSLGLLKKVLLADTFAKAVGWVYGHLSAATAMDCMLLVLFYTFEIYFDFSGYSDMAIGVSSMFNIDLPMNFDSPYKAVSIRDFWKRWHISLTKFLTRYIYIPLGGSRKGKLFTYVNTMIVFLVSGLWHGANWTFILWGLLHGIFSCLDRALEKREEEIFLPVRWLCTFCAVAVLWLLFSADSVGQWKGIMAKILFFQNTKVNTGLINSFDLAETQLLYQLPVLGYLAKKVRGFNMLAFTLAAGFLCLVPENNYRNKDRLTAGSLLLASLAFIWGVFCLGSESVFVYFGF